MLAGPFPLQHRICGPFPMKARILRLDASYEVTFSRPVFSRLASFAQIIEPIHDALSREITIPPDAVTVENGNSIATASVSVTLPFGNSVLEARLDGYRAHFVDLRSPEDTDRARRHVERFEEAVLAFLSDGAPKVWTLTTPYWLMLDDGGPAAERILRSLTWLPDDADPFRLGATNTQSQVRFTCSNMPGLWTAVITLDKSALPSADLFVEVSGIYGPGCGFNTLGERADHLSALSKSIADRLSLDVG